MKRTFFGILAVLSMVCPLCSYTIYDFIKPLPEERLESFAFEWELDELFSSRDIRTVLDLGAGQGESTLYFAERVGPKGSVIAVDEWHCATAKDILLKEGNMADAFQRFLCNMKASGFEDLVVPIRMKREEAVKAVTYKVDLIYFSPTEAGALSHKRLLEWCRRLLPRGVICGGGWKDGHVHSLVEKTLSKLNKNAVKKHRKSVKASGDFWYID